MDIVCGGEACTGQGFEAETVSMTTYYTLFDTDTTVSQFPSQSVPGKLQEGS